jgi:NAD(P)-dependent dehydrogenase (short-subunit alcohol dehydrogenase family)
MDLHLQDKIVIVTGGASGIGAAICSQLAQEGAVPVVFDRSPVAPELLAKWQATSPRASASQLDLTDEAACRDAVDATLATYGGIDGLVNNAGINDGVSLSAGRAAFMHSLEANLVHTYLLAHLCEAQLKACRGAITYTRRNSRSGTCCPPAARPSSLPPTCCRCFISAIPCSSAPARRPIPGMRPGWNGRRRRRPPNSILRSSPW